jgi:hypothetical protein
MFYHLSLSLSKSNNNWGVERKKLPVESIVNYEIDWSTFEILRQCTTRFLLLHPRKQAGRESVLNNNKTEEEKK